MATKSIGKKVKKDDNATTLLKLIPTPVIAIDTDYKITYINELGAAALGKKVEEVVGTKCYDQFNTPHCKTDECRCSQAMKSVGVFTGDTVAHIGSKLLPIRYTGTPIKDEKGNVVGALEYVLDISEEANITESLSDLVLATVDGKLDTRADSTMFSGNYKKIVEGVNELIDAFVAPINVTAEYVDRISKGDIPAKITDDYKGDFNEIKNNLNQCIDVVGSLVDETSRLTKATIEGDLLSRGNAEKFTGDYNKIVNGINGTLDTLVGHIDKIPAPAMIIDEQFNIKYISKSGADIIGKSQKQLVGTKCHEHFKTSDCGTDRCACARAMQNNAIASSETDAHPNGMDLQISYTGVPVRDQQGKVIGALEIVIDQTQAKKAMADAGVKVDYLNKIPTPVMVVDRDFNVQFMNPAGASAVGKTPESCIGQKCFNLFNTSHCNTADCQVAKAMLQNSIFTNDTVAKLPSGELPIRYTGAPLKDKNGNIVGGLEYVTDISKEMEITSGVLELAEAALNGQLDRRADENKFMGNYRRIIEGVNKTLDAVIGPLNVAAEYVDRISKGDIPDKITDEYKGDFNEIKNNLNQCIDAVDLLVKDARGLADAAVAGKLNTRAEADKHQGDFAKIVQGVNDTLDAILGPINEAAQVLERLSQYDLRVRVQGDYQGDHAKIKNSLNLTAEALHDALSQVAEAVDQVSAASEQISSSSQVVAEGASEQASSLEETSSSLEEMAGMTKQNADNAIQANTLAQGANSAAGNGSQAMQKMLEAMSKIRQASEDTAEIIKDINEIAFQTNLLALNAAVEAARAGDAGRGFAVVAEEVRNLAQRAKEAAKKTEELIKGSAKLAEEGEVISKNVNANLGEIVTSVDKVTNIIQEITAASQEQSRGIEQINKAVSEMDKVTQQNAANSEESSSAAEELSSQAQELAAMIGRFHLNRAAQKHSSEHLSVAKHTLVHKKQPKAQSMKKAIGDDDFNRRHAERMIPLDDDQNFQDF